MGTSHLGKALESACAVAAAVRMTVGLAPSAHAAASYDVTQVGKVTIQSITDGNGRQLNGTHDGREITGGFTPNAYMISTRVRYGIHIDDMSRLAEGDRITIGQSSTGHFEVAAYSGGSVVNDQAGTPVFSIGWTRARITLTRLPGSLTGGMDLTFTSNLCTSYRDYGSREKLYATSSTWTIGGDSYTFPNTPFAMRAATGGKDFAASTVIQRLANQVTLQSHLRWPGAINDMLNGGAITPDTSDTIVHDHITPMDGTISAVRFGSMLNRWPLAYDKTHLSDSSDFAVASADHGHPNDVHSLDEAKRLKPGQSSIVRNTDGSYDVAANLGSFTGPDALAETTRTWDGNTNDIIAWLHEHQCTSAWTSYRYDIVWSDPNQADTAMVETHLYRAGKTYTGTLTAANIAGSTGQAVTTGGVSYDPNGGDGAMTPTIGESGTGVTAADNAFTRTGYTFAGWNTAKDGTGTAHQPGDALVLTKSVVVLYAQWRPITYKVRFDGNGATSGMMSDLTATYDERKTLPANRYAKSGETFAGWNTRPDGTGKSFTDKQTVADLLTHENAVGTLYAQWAPTPPVITVVFHSNDGGADETVKRVWASNNLDMKAIGLPDGWTKKGFVFHGWNLAADGSGVEYKTGESLYGRMTTATVDLYADWAGLQSTLPQAGGSTKAPAYGAGLALMVLGAGAWLSAGRRRRMA